MTSFNTFSIIKRNVIIAFLSGIMQCTDDISEIWIVSPWVSVIERWQDTFDKFYSTFDSFIKRIDRKKINVTIVTRSPTSDTENSFIQKFEEIETARILFLQTLHAKIYICENKKMDFAIIGSPNFTTKSISNIEVGLFINAIQDGKKIIEDLIETCNDIISLKKCVYHKKRPLIIKSI